MLHYFLLYFFFADLGFALLGPSLWLEVLLSHIISVEIFTMLGRPDCHKAVSHHSTEAEAQ
jgi:hypothetical protein